MFPLIGLFGASVITALGHTLSIKYIDQEHLERSKADGGQVIYAFWHEGLLVATYAFRRQDIRVLVSQHRDGEYISRTIERMGYTTTRGSSTRGGTRALFRMAAAGSAGDDLGVTVDGPRGPRREVKPGIIYMAARSGLPILPFAVSCATPYVLSSWDQFMIPWPFTRVNIAFGEPIHLPEELDGNAVEAYRRLLENRLLSARKTADQSLI
jgi:lysophospholipid acyltransferase (LPLAT)-like uncharacterized protein